MDTSLFDAIDRWSATTSATDQALTVLAWVAAAVGSYLALVALAYTGALVARSPGLVRGLDPFTPAIVRRLAHRVVAVTLVTTSWGGGAVALAAETAPLPPALQVPVSVPAPAEVLPSPELPSPELPAPQVAPPRGAAPAVRVAPAAPASVTVVAGDHLWGIAERTLTVARGGEVAPADVVRYWREVVDLNTPRLRSGDPDLIHPGETVHLPPPVER